MLKQKRDDNLGDCCISSVEEQVSIKEKKEKMEIANCMGIIPGDVMKLGRLVRMV